MGQKNISKVFPTSGLDFRSAKKIGNLDAFIVTAPSSKSQTQRSLMNDKQYMLSVTEFAKEIGENVQFEPTDLVSSDPGNNLVIGSDGKLYVGDPNPADLISAQTPNLITVGGDGKLFVQDAPSDGGLYGRQDGAWQPIGTLEIVNYVSDATSDAEPDISSAWNDYGDRLNISRTQNQIIVFNWPGGSSDNYNYTGAQLAPPWTTVNAEWSVVGGTIISWGDIVGDIDNQTDLANALDAKGAVGLDYTFIADTTSTDPGNGNIKVNNADQSLATEIYVSGLSALANDLTKYLSGLQEGDLVNLVEGQFEREFSTFEINGTPTDNGTWFILPVTNLDFRGPINIGAETQLFWQSQPNSTLRRGGDPNFVLAKASANAWDTTWVDVNTLVTPPAPTTPGGGEGAIQFNAAGAFAGDETKLFWDSVNGRLGIGTGTPTRNLHVVGGALITGLIQGVNAKWSVNTISNFPVMNMTTSSTSETVISISGNVATPGFIHADADYTFTIGRARFSSPTSNIAHFSHTAMTDVNAYAIRQNVNGATKVNAPTGQSIGFSINDADKWVVNTSGDLIGSANKIGIGIGAPLTPLHIQSNAAEAVRLYRVGGGGQNVEFYGDNAIAVLTNVEAGRITMQVQDGGNGQYVLYVREPGGSTVINQVHTDVLHDFKFPLLVRDRMDAESFISSNLGFIAYNGNNADLASSITLDYLNDQARLRYGGSGPGANTGFSIQRAGDAKLVEWTNAGDMTNFGSVTVSAASDFKLKLLDTRGSSDWRIGTFGGGNNNFFIQDTTGAGQLVLQIAPTTGVATFISSVTATNFQLSSDVRDKDIVKSLGHGRFEYFEYKDKIHGDVRSGVSAQAVKKIDPNLVRKAEDGKYKVSYIDLLIQEVARLSNEVEALKNG